MNKLALTSQQLGTSDETPVSTFCFVLIIINYSLCRYHLSSQVLFWAAIRDNKIICVSYNAKKSQINISFHHTSPYVSHEAHHISRGNNRGVDFHHKQLASAASISDVQKLRTSSTEFGLNIYNELRKDTSVTNIFLSPASISLALSMVLLGAKGTANSTFEWALPEIPKNVILDEFASGLKHACAQM